MSTLLKSTFETYLFDEEVEFELAEQRRGNGKRRTHAISARFFLKPVKESLK